MEILRVVEQLPHGQVVEFTTSYGIGRGVWPYHTPLPPATFEAELEIDEELVWGQTIVLMEDEVDRIHVTPGTVTFQGQLDHVAPDGVCILRMGNSILLLATSGDAPLVGVCVQVFARHVILYDTNV